MCETSEIDLGQSVTVNYSVENKSKKSFYLVREEKQRIRLFGENMLAEAPSALPTNHGDFDFTFIQIQPKKKAFGQVVIPKEVREDSGIKAGSKMDIFAYDARIELVPIKPIKQLKASLPGLNMQIDREADRL